MLVLDRFLSCRSSALDLATGQPVRIRSSVRIPPPPLFVRRGSWRLVDSGPRSTRVFIEAWERWGRGPVPAPAPTDAVRGALLDARDGRPRAVDITTDDAPHWRRTAHEIAREARLAGFVPIAADVLGELLSASKGRWPRWLADRSLVILTCDGHVSATAAVALLRLATRDARPHLVVRGATSALLRPSRLMRPAWSVHESGVPDVEPEPLSAEALADDAWQRATTGPPDDESRASAHWAVLLAPTVDTEARARAALASALAAHGRPLEARAALAPAIDTLGQVTGETAHRLRDAQARVAHASEPRRIDRSLIDDLLRLIDLWQSAEDDECALSRMLALLRDRIAAASLAFTTLETGQVRVVSQVGAQVVDLRIAQTVMVSGVAAPPAGGHGPTEAAWPVRSGGTVVGALWCRWPAGLPITAEDAAGLMGMAAATAGPALQAVAERGRAAAAAPDIPDLVGDSEGMRRLRSDLVRAARSPFPVLIEGESGSGKEIVARAIHHASPRQKRRLSALNCAALAEELAEAELFGHARGAFTGAIVERPGLFEEANGGTVFLDEVSELSPRIQAKLLRVLQEHEVRRLGEPHVRRIDTRIVAATNRPLGAEVDAGRFRRDLWYRLDVVRLMVPPLRERIEDVPALTRHLWARLCESTGSRAVLSSSAMTALGRYDWPGNVRELQNVLASVIVTAPARGSIGAALLPAHVARTAALVQAPSLASARHEFEVRYVKAALARAGGRAGPAARELGVSRQGLAKVLSRLGLSATPGGGGKRV